MLIFFFTYCSFRNVGFPITINRDLHNQVFKRKGSKSLSNTTICRTGLTHQAFLLYCIEIFPVLQHKRHSIEKSKLQEVIPNGIQSDYIGVTAQANVFDIQSTIINIRLIYS